MLRECDLKEISDGKLYTLTDMVKVGCKDCEGCSSCCRNMSDTILLDPYDVYHLCKGTGKSFGELCGQELELRVTEGLILPHLKMQEGQNCCAFLNEAGRCSIHGFRPGICRLFPLGRIYEDRDFKYFLQVRECQKTNRTKMKVSQWLGIPEPKKYESYIKEWHFFLKDIQEILERSGDDIRQQLNTRLLHWFFAAPYEMEADFYEQFYGRLTRMKEILGL